MRKILVALALCALGAAASAEEESPALAALQRWLDGTKDLQARFEQSLLSSALGAGPSESGRIYLRRPGRMRWEYTDPEAKIAVRAILANLLTLGPKAAPNPGAPGAPSVGA